MKNADLMFGDECSELIRKYKDGDSSHDEPLDGDEVDVLTEHIRNVINLHEGNITQEEYEDLEERASEIAQTRYCPNCKCGGCETLRFNKGDD